MIRHKIGCSKHMVGYIGNSYRFNDRIPFEQPIEKDVLQSVYGCSSDTQWRSSKKQPHIWTRHIIRHIFRCVTWEKVERLSERGAFPNSGNVTSGKLNLGGYYCDCSPRMLNKVTLLEQMHSDFGRFLWTSVPSKRNVVSSTNDDDMKRITEINE